MLEALIIISALNPNPFPYPPINPNPGQPRIGDRVGLASQNKAVSSR